jgi:AmmeMemoRadiSam system protein B
VAGRFYPGTAEALGTLVDSLLDEAPPAGAATVVVVPHAGYRFSGATAARAYAGLPGDTKRVVVIGPAHYARIQGCVVPEASAWRTPLGPVPVDAGLSAELLSAGLVRADDEPFEREHSLEVQLPFVQRRLRPGVPVLPIAVGPSTVDQVVPVLERAVAPGTALVCSTDLSHYLTEAAAVERDTRTVDSILALAPERISVGDACGRYPLKALLGWARTANLRADLLHRCTSADTGGSPDRVVGYAAVALRPSPSQ